MGALPWRGTTVFIVDSIFSMRDPAKITGSIYSLIRVTAQRVTLNEEMRSAFRVQRSAFSVTTPGRINMAGCLLISGTLFFQASIVLV